MFGILSTAFSNQGVNRYFMCQSPLRHLIIISNNNQTFYVLCFVPNIITHCTAPAFSSLSSQEVPKGVPFFSFRVQANKQTWILLRIPLSFCCLCFAFFINESPHTKMLSSFVFLLTFVSCLSFCTTESVVVPCGLHPSHYPSNNNHHTITGRIIHGDVADTGDFPWTVLLLQITKNEESSICGGSILSPRVIMTAAHYM